MLVVGFPAGPWGTNCWVVATGAGEQCVDRRPGQGRGAGHRRRRSASTGLQPVAVLLTHGHIDHVWSVVPVCGARGIPAYLHPDDRGDARRPHGRDQRPDARHAREHDRRHAAAGRAGRRPRARPTALVLELAGLELTVDHAPGHTRGSVMFRRRRGRGAAADAALGRRAVRGLDRSHRPAGRRPRRDARQPAPRRCCPSTTRPWSCPGTAARRPSVASAPPTPTSRRWPPSRRPARHGGCDDEPSHAAVRLPRVAARRAHRRAARCSTRCAASSSCTASPRSRPAPSSRSSRCCARARSTRRSTSCAGCTPTPTSADAGLGLHFDLTVPFARYVLQNAGHLEFPFRRYQIQKVLARRAAAGGPLPRVHPGRHRRHRARHPRRSTTRSRSRWSWPRCFRALPLPARGDPGQQPQARRGLLPRRRARRTPPRCCGPIDKLDKIGPAKVARAARGRGRARRAEGAQQCLALAAIRSADVGFVEQVRALGVEHPLLDEGLERARGGRRGGRRARMPGAVVADLKIARGLDYYTGTVYETQLVGYESFGSVCSGGRYDALASDGRTTYPGRRHLARRHAAAGGCSSVAGW